MDDLVFYLAVAIDRLGGELRITDAETDAFDAADRSLKIEQILGGTVLSVADNTMGDGVSAQVVLADGTVLTLAEGE